MLQDNFAAEAQRLGMSYRDYAIYRAKQAKQRCYNPFKQAPQKATSEPERIEYHPTPTPEPKPIPEPSVATNPRPTLEELSEEIKRLQQQMRDIQKQDSEKALPFHRQRIWELMHPGESPKTLTQIAMEVCERWGFSLIEMRSDRRDRRLVTARHEFWWRCQHETYKSLPEMGRFLRKDHTTALHGIKRYEKLREAKAAGTLHKAYGLAELHREIGGMLL